MWTGYTLGWTGWYPLWELGNFQEKRVWVFTIVFMIIMAGILVVLNYLLHFHVVEWTIGLAKTYGPAAAFVSLLIGVVASEVLQKVTENRIKSNDMILK